MALRTRSTGLVSAALLAALGLSACASEYGPEPYPAYAVGRAARVEEGRVISARPVAVTGESTGAGAVAGAVVGALAGSAVAGRHDRGGGAVAGAVVGGLAGNALEQNSTRTAFAYMVRRRDGATFEVVQPDAYPIPAGTPVNIVYADRVRIEPIGGYPPPPPPPGY
jgi:outer membrane lipoprotein SlyB